MPLWPPLDAPVDEVRAALAPLRNDFAVALVGPGNDFAVGAVIRTAHSFLAREVIVVGTPRWYPKASMGMEKYETITVLPDVPALLAHVGARPLYCFEREAARRSVYELGAFPPGVVMAFGSERAGLPPELLARATERVAIPLYGVNNSLPLAVAAGIAMSEFARRRYGPGAAL